MQLFTKHWIDAVLLTAAFFIRKKMHIAATVSVIKLLISGMVNKACRCLACRWSILYDTITSRSCSKCANVPIYLASAVVPVGLQCGLCCLMVLSYIMLKIAIAQAPLCSAGCICPCRGPFATFQPLVGQGSLSTAPGLVGGLPLQAVKPTLELQTV